MSFLLYLGAFIGNAFIVKAISLHPGLQASVNLFFTNLALVDTTHTLTISPKLLENLVVNQVDCMVQLFFLIRLLGAKPLLLLAVACDCHVAIYHPMHYSMLRSWPICALLSGSMWAVTAVSTSVHTGVMTRLTFRGPCQIHHFLHEVPKLLLLSGR